MIEIQEVNIDRFDIDAGLRRQHLEFLREGYDGHNRHPDRTTMHYLGVKHSRRRWNIKLKYMVREYNLH